MLLLGMKIFGSSACKIIDHQLEFIIVQDVKILVVFTTKTGRGVGGVGPTTNYFVIFKPGSGQLLAILWFFNRGLVNYTAIFLIFFIAKNGQKIGKKCQKICQNLFTRGLANY